MVTANPPGHGGFIDHGVPVPLAGRRGVVAARAKAIGSFVGRDI